MPHLKQQQQNIIIAAAGAEELIEDQGGNVTQIYDRVLNGFVVEGVEDVTPLIQDPAIDSVEPNVRLFPQTQYLPAAVDQDLIWIRPSRLQADRTIEKADQILMLQSLTACGFTASRSCCCFTC